jgi:fucose 4-O-acetylase-like acetyltransferase
MHFTSTHTGSRDPSLDIAKTFLIWLVVFGHLIEPFIANDVSTRWAYIFIYSFHVPALVFVSGMFARAEVSWVAMGKILTQLVQPLIICQILFWAMEVFVFGNEFDWYKALTRPYWLLWYLASLVCWRLLMIPLSRVKIALASSVLIALIAGGAKYIGYDGSFSRTLVLLPFFVAGYQVSTMGKLPFVSLEKFKLYAWLLIVSFAVLAFILASNGFKPEWLYHVKSYSRLKLDDVSGAAMRIVMLIGAGTMIWSMLVLLPKRTGWFSYAGQHSLLPYLTHGFAVYLATGFGWFVYAEGMMSPIAILLASFIVSGAIIALCVTKPMILLQTALYTPSSLFGRRTMKTADLPIIAEVKQA